MKILYIITQGENGGAQKNVLDMATSAKKSNDVYVAAGRQNTDKDTWLFGELEKNGFGKSHLQTFENLIRNISPIAEVKAFVEMHKYIKQNGFEIVHLHSSKAGTLGSVAGKLAGAKVVYTVHGFIFQEPMSFLKKMFYIIAEFTASFFIDYHICVSQKDLEVGQKYFILRNRKKYSVIYNGINNSPDFLLTRDKAQEYIKSQINIDLENTVVFGNIANLYATKGLTYFIEAAEILKGRTSQKFVCVIFGEGELRKILEEQIKNSGLENNFYLLGYTQGASQYLRGLDAFVMSSVKEGLPYALVEASLAELPIIATNIGGIPEMSKHFSINLVEAKSCEALANAMQKFLDEKTRLSKTSEFNPVFSLENMTKKTIAVYEQVRG